MKTLSKLKLHALKNDSESVLSKEKLKNIRGGAINVCTIYCSDNSGYKRPVGISVSSCSSYGYTCAGDQATSCECV